MTNELPVLPKPWSFSSLNDFITCGRQYHEVRILRAYEREQGEAAAWGERVHEALELYVRDGRPLESEFSGYQAVADTVRGLRGTVLTETQMTVRHDLTPCDWDDPTAWARGIADFIQIVGDKLLVGDWKTGKVKVGSKQLLLFALLAKAYYPQVTEVTTVFIWLKFGKVTKATYDLSHPNFVRVLWKQFDTDLRRLAAAYEHDDWRPNPSGLCKKYCVVTECEYNGRR